MRNFCLFSLLIFTTAASSTAGKLGILRGELTCRGCNSYTGLSVELMDTDGHRLVDRVQVNPTGEFEVRGDQHGVFILSVVDQRGVTIRKEMVSMGDHNLRISLGQSQPERPVSGTISVARLQHKVPKAAEKAFFQSVEAFDKRDVRKSLELLEKAVALDAEYMEAYNNLGARYLMLNEFEKAIVAFERALELDPSAAMVYTNLALALLSTGKATQAEVAARRGLDMNRGDEKAGYILGLSLYHQQRFTPETVGLLTAAESKFPTAKLALSVILIRQGSISQAREKLTALSQSPSREHSRLAQDLLAKID